ncbi:MAG TPA: effector-associated domain EAD1-containing protein, partial [Chloroflexia bacterium]|nr:effector-associated domain EAD1-containing protein [Chloroflexia bacterium]
MAVSGAHAQQLTEALCAAFPSRDALAQMVRFGLNANLATISQGADLQQDAFALITWADAQDRVGELVAAARAANPTNLALQALAAPWGSGATFLPPPLPETFVARPAQYVELKAALLAADPATPVAITTALQGAGGFGKTVLASALCADPDVQARFPDGICWVTLGEQPDVPQLLAALYTHVRGRPPATADIPALVEGLATHWGQQPGLLVLDDAWQEADLAPFLQAGRACTRLVTTRNLAVVPKAHWVRLDEMQTTEAAALLAAHLADPPADLAVLAPLARQLGEWPLLLALAGPVLQQQLALGDPLPQALDFVRDALREEGVTVFDRTADTARRQAVAGTLTLSLRLLQAEERPRYAELAIFPEDQAIPLAVVGGLWGTGAYATKKLVSRLASLALLAFDPPA